MIFKRLRQFQSLERQSWLYGRMRKGSSPSVLFQHYISHSFMFSANGTFINFKFLNPKCPSTSLLIFNHAAMLYVSFTISLVLSFAHFGWEGGTQYCLQRQHTSQACYPSRTQISAIWVLTSPVLLVEYGITLYYHLLPVIYCGGYWSMYATDNVGYNKQITFCSL
jgi:hypothetical protein